jgi:hypothetical protein
MTLEELSSRLGVLEETRERDKALLLRSYSATFTKRPSEYCVPHAYRGVKGLRR